MRKRNYLLRSVGLELPTLVRSGSPASEIPKSVFRTSLKAALSNSAIHILPILASITVVTLNLKTIYVGRTLTGQIESAAINIAMLQVTAKLVELLIIASLTNIVVYTIRMEMVLGDGVPLGAVGGAFMFSSLSYLWSPELWGSFQSNSTLSVKLRLYGILILSGLLAATVGPSTAVLIIPRDQDWSAGGSEIYIRGSSDEVWPTQVDYTLSGAEPFCSFPNATDYGVCPSGGYLSMLPFRTTVLQLHNFLDMQQNVSSFMFGSTSTLIPSTFHRMPGLSLTGNWRSFACETSMTGVHGAEAIYLSQLLTDWKQVVMSIPYAPLTTTISEYKYNDNLMGTISSRVPVVRVACSDAQNVSSVNNEIQFPVLPNHGCWNSMEYFEYADLNQTSSDRLKTTWVLLPAQFGRVSAGLLFEAPWVDGSSRVVLGCSVDARWADATLSSTGSTGTSCQASVTDLARGYDISDWPKYSEFRPTNGSSWSPIQLQQSWLDVLTPYVEVNDVSGGQPWRATTLESLLYGTVATNDLFHSSLSQTAVWNKMDLGSLNRTISLEWVLATVVADGLSREGSARVLDTTGELSSWTILDYNKTTDFQSQLLCGGMPLEQPVGVELITNRASIQISGYSYKASLFTDYLSISILLIYILLALYHAVEIVFTRRASACWDTITELLALMQNSRPATLALKNTCAGIKELSTYAKVAIIRVTQPSAATSATPIPHIEVIFREEEHIPVELRTLLNDSTSPNARLLGAPIHANTWSAVPRNFNSSRSTAEDGWRHSERHRPGSELTMTQVQVNSLYG
ncbi:hypothetical protein MMC18_002533 [Xylographa bjoerkii]|nr:hypothetical protein [Xylographa bjoerkii]